MKRRRARVAPGEQPAYTRIAPHRFVQRLARLDVEPGLCRVCGEQVGQGSKARRVRSWHDGRLTASGEREPNCLHRYKIATRPSYAKAMIARRDGRSCRSCGATKGRSWKWLHLDHVVPLKDGGAADEPNLQLLCPACHALKTSAEATQRSIARKAMRLAAASVGQ